MLPRIFRQNSIDNFFDDFAFDAPFGIAHRDAKHEWNGLMKMDIRDKDGQYTADIELPGCKKEDIAIELNNGYLLSPKDLKTIGFLDKMVHAGVSVFKIEGRARGPEYVRTVVSCYDEALRAIADGGFTAERVADWNERLAEVFNRGFWDGYYLGTPTVELAGGYGSQAKLKKRFVGKCLKYFSRARVAQFLIQAEGFEKGARLLVTGPTTGAVEFSAESMMKDDQRVDACAKGQDITIQIPCKVRENDKLYLLQPRDAPLLS